MEKKKGKASIAEVKEVKNSLFFLSLSCELSLKMNTWTIDSGASRHIVGFKD